MNISKDVIRDLLPVYVAGEASADTRAVVERALAGDADLRSEAAMIGTVPAVHAIPPAALGLDALKRTQRLLRRRALLAGFSVFFSTFPLAMVDRSWGLIGHLGQAACLLMAAAGWSLFFRNAVRLHAVGLESARSPHPKFAWACATILFATSVWLSIQDWTGLDFGWWGSLWTVGILLLFWIPVYRIGRRLSQLPAPSEIDEVESLIALARDPDAHV